MHPRALALPLVLLLLLAVVPQPVHAQQAFTVSGFIISIQSSQAAFTLQELRTGAAGSAWTVHVTAATEARRPGGDTVRGPQAVLNLLRVGEVADAQGWVIGTNRLLATAVTVRSFLGDVSPDRNNDRDDDDDRADDGDRDVARGIRVAGVIITLQSRGQGVFQLREQSLASGYRTWTVRLHPSTRVQGQVLDRARDVQVGQGDRAALRFLRVGDFVEVEGRVVGRAQIQARRIRIHARADTPVPFPIPSPYPPYPFPNPNPFPAQTVILAPAQGTEITTSEFSVVGQTMPGAQVRIEVTARFGVFNLPVTSGTVTANQSGFFTFTVRPSMRVPGTVYTITVRSTYQGYTTPPVSITVRQQ